VRRLWSALRSSGERAARYASTVPGTSVPVGLDVPGDRGRDPARFAAID
jgi:hypothetical protein